MANDWFIVRDGQQYGPYNAQRLKDMVAAGQVVRTDQVRRQDMAAPRPATDIKGLFPQSVPPPPRPPPPAVLLQTAPVQAPPVAIPAAIPAAAPAPVTAAGPAPVKWYNSKWFRIGLAVLVVIIGIAKISNGGKSGGTIAFAEQVDPKTMKTTNEGTRFSTGRVWLVIRGKKPFGDSKLIIYGRLHGHEAWTVLSEETVDPKWDVAALQDELEEPGKFDIKAMTSKGDVVAQSTVEIVGR